MVVALIALIVALGGSAYAATQIGSKQIRNGSVRSVDIRDANLSGKDLRPGAIGDPQLAPDVLRGKIGPVVVRRAAKIVNGPAQAFCRQDEIAVGGGWEPTSGFAGDLDIYASRPIPRPHPTRITRPVVPEGATAGGWYVSGDGTDFVAYAMCAQVDR